MKDKSFLNNKTTCERRKLGCLGDRMSVLVVRFLTLFLCYSRSRSLDETLNRYLKLSQYTYTQMRTAVCGDGYALFYNNNNRYCAGAVFYRRRSAVMRIEAVPHNKHPSYHFGAHEVSEMPRRETSRA